MTEPTPQPPVLRPRRRRSLGDRLAGLLRSFFRIVELTARTIVSLMVVALTLVVLSWLWPDDLPVVGDSTALVVAPNGFLTEQLTGYPAQQALLEMLGQSVDPETLMDPLLEAIEHAKDDDRVRVLALDLNGLMGGGLSKLQDLRRAIESFKESGKPVVAFSDVYFQSQYYLAAAADEVFVNPLGMVVLQGYGSYRRYYKEAIEAIGAEWNVFRVGQFKSAVEPYLRTDMSDEARESRKEWLGDLWNSYRNDVARARGIAPEAVEAYVSDFHLKLAEYGGNAAELALAEGLVTQVATRDQLRDRLIELVGEEDDGLSYNRIGPVSYLLATVDDDKGGAGKIAVVVASGAILDGHQPPGTIGGESTAELIREAREADDIDALVLRVDSPGGSAFASELIRRELELTQAAGKPVVASMGSVAASGGYWIAMSADRILASDTTITGSIGIYAMIPTFEQTLAKVKIYNDGVGTHAISGLSGLDRDLPMEASEAVQLMIEQGYRDFITRAAAGRDMTVEEIDKIAQGRVWSGQDARELGLVDEMGDLEAALDIAAELAEIEGGYDVVKYEVAPGWEEQFLGLFLSRVNTWMSRSPVRAPLSELPLFRELAKDVSMLAGSGRPFEPLAYCLCDYE